VQLANFSPKHNPVRQFVYYPWMDWIEAHRAIIGILADTLTFLGGCLLARDAFLRLKDLKSKRIDEAFRREFPRLNLTDDEWNAAVVSLRWALAGFVLMVLGFLAQLLLRFVEP
jgi:hypothetical protein